MIYEIGGIVHNHPTRNPICVPLPYAVSEQQIMEVDIRDMSWETCVRSVSVR